MRISARHRAGPALRAMVGLAGLVVAGPAAAARWDTYNNANVLNSVTATGTVVWAASDLGLHRFDPATGSFTRFAKSPGRLASNAIVEVEIDAAGNTWFATRDRGVSILLAGGTWRQLTTFDGLPSDSTSALEPSALGMWVGTRAGLAFFEGFDLAAVWPDGVNPSPFLSDIVTDIAHAGDSTWVATTNGVYVTATAVGLEWRRAVTGLATLSVQAVAGLGTEAWAVAGGHVYRMDAAGTWVATEAGLSAATARTIEGGAGVLLVAIAEGVYRWDGSAWVPLGSPGAPVQSWVEVDPAGGFWAANVEGLWRWDGAAWRYHRSPGPHSNWVQGMAVDRTRGRSNLWITTRSPGGAARFDGTSWRSFFPTGAASPDTTFLSLEGTFGLLVDRDGYKWAGQWGWSVARIDDATEPPQFDHFWYNLARDSVLHTFVWATAEDAQERRWFGLDTPSRGVIIPLGLDRIADDGARANYNPSDGAAMSERQVRSIAFAPDGEMWVGYADAGIDIFSATDVENGLLTRSGRITGTLGGLPSDDVWSIRMYGDSVWVGTSSGLVRFSRADRQRKESFITQSASSQGAVTPLAIDATGGVWWATKVGLYHRKPDRTTEIFTEANSPLLSDDVHSVVADLGSGAVWIGSVLGVNRYDPAASDDSGPTGGGSLAVYPNPAFLSAIGLQLRAAGLTGVFRGEVFDVRGRLVRRLLGNASTSGGQVWDARDEGGIRVPPGLYFLRVESGGRALTGRVVLMR